MANIYELAQKLGAKNILKTPMAQNYLAQAERAGQSQDLLQQAQTPIGAISAGIANYINQKRKGEALEQLNKEYEAQQAAQAEKRQALINTLPEEQRPLGNFLSDEDLSGYVAKSLTPRSEKDLLSIENQRLQNQKLRRDINNPAGNQDEEFKRLRNQKLRNDLQGLKPNKPLPTQALKLQNEALEDLGLSSAIQSDLDSLDKQIEKGKLDLGPLTNLGSRTLNYAGMSTENSRNFSSFKSTLEKLRNDSLRLNKGVQTEGDAKRIWNELIANINDPDLVQQRLKEISAVNKRGANLKKLQVDQIRANYGAEPLDYSQFENTESALGSGENTQNQSYRQSFPVNQNYGQSFPVNQSYNQDLKSKYGLE